jgi:hypothetical protein
VFAIRTKARRKGHHPRFRERRSQGEPFAIPKVPLARRGRDGWRRLPNGVRIGRGRLRDSPGIVRGTSASGSGGASVTAAFRSASAMTAAW